MRVGVSAQREAVMDGGERVGSVTECLRIGADVRVPKLCVTFMISKP